MTPFTDQPELSTHEAETFWRLPIGAASPLWAAYATAASAGIAFWWMSKLTKPMNLEAWQWRPQLPALPTTTTLPAVVAETLAAVQPEPVAPPSDPVADPASIEGRLAEVGVETMEEAADALGEAAISVSIAADDLTRLVGIGPSLAGKLANMGVRTFADIAAWTDEDLQKVDRALDLKGRAVRDRWIDQARQFAAQ